MEGVDPIPPADDSAAGNLFDVLLSAAPLAAVIAVGIFVIWRLERWYERKPRSLVRPVAMLGVSILLLVAAIVAAPVDHETRGQLVTLLGIGLTAVIALASTTFVSNLMAGLMLRSLRNFAPGDFIDVEGRFGRVTERGLFHTEIQTEDRALTTIPNFLLATKPTTVIRADGTILSAEISLGYDAPRAEVEAALLQGAGAAGLEDPFVQVMNLGDFSVTYRVAGVLKEVKYLVSARSNLRICAMDALHAAGIEIVSPTFMNQRGIGEEAVIPRTSPATVATPVNDGAAEKVMFDLADEAAELEDLERKLDALREELEDASGEEAERQHAQVKRLEELVKRRREEREQEKQAARLERGDEPAEREETP